MNVQKIFQYPQQGFSWNNMKGHIRPKNKSGKYAKEQFIFVTLKKEDKLKSDLKYDDHFVNEKLFRWEAEKLNTKASRTAIIDHKKNNSDLHLFVRSHHAAPTPFIYCGKINFIDGESDKLQNLSFSANFELENPLLGEMKEEFLRISKLINVNIEK